MIILNEKKYVENIILPTGEVNKKPSLTLMLLAKYYKAMNKSPTEIREILNAYMTRNYEYYSPDLWSKTFQSLSLKQKGMEMRELDSIPIYVSEIKKIRQLENIKLEKLAFGMLCFAKLCNATSEMNNNWINCKISNLFTACNVYVSKSEDKFYMLHELYEKGDYIGLSNKNTNLNVRVLFVEETGEIAFTVSSFEALGYEYLNYVGEGNYIRCALCDTLFKARKNDNRKYCKLHTGYQSKKQDVIECIDCGKIRFVSSLGTKSCRCEECQKEEHKKKNRENMRRTRQN